MKPRISINSVKFALPLLLAAAFLNVGASDCTPPKAAGAPAKMKRFEVACANSISGNMTPYELELAIDPTEIRANSVFTVEVSGTLHVPMEIFDALFVIFPAVQTIVLNHMSASVVARSGAEGSPVLLTTEPHLFDVPVSQDGAQCAAANKYDQYLAHGACVTGGKDFPLDPVFALFLASESGEVLFGLDDSNAVVSTDGAVTIPQPTTSEPADFGFSMTMFGALQFTNHCAMAVNVDGLDAQHYELTPDAELISFVIAAP